MSLPLPLLRGTITLSEALDEDDDILKELSYPDKRLNFYCYLYQHRKAIEDLVAFHLGVRKDACKVAGEFSEWVHGSFNACVPVSIDKSATCGAGKVFIRFPLPYKVGESQCPGNAEEKLRCEVATYIWIQSHCPDILIPCLRGFGFAGGLSFTAPENAPTYSRIAWFLRRTALWLSGHAIPSPYIRRHPPHHFEVGYLIVDCAEGDMLSESWTSQQHDEQRRANLFRDLARIMLSLSRFPFPRIGSMTIDDHGALSLTNRPLTCSLQQLENRGIPTEISRNTTYSSADTYFSDLLACHDNSIRYMPNAIHDAIDGQEQLSALTMMRALLRHFTDRDLRHGPFVLMLTDLHQSNIFVNSNWQITGIIDLEWACARPVEMQRPPYWLTGLALDGLIADLGSFQIAYTEFVKAFEAEERSLGKVDIPYTRMMRKGWETGNYWYFSALDCPKGLSSLYYSHIRPRFEKLDDHTPVSDRTLSAYWTTDAAEFITSKLKQKEMYSDELHKTFGAAVRELG